ncbi:MAG: response regulator transcription factor [Verrucomicrobiota bacterium]|nr:response regulator transcription factor [Verrucomicrobiota bacterium]
MSNERILIVDDEEDILELLEYNLKMEGYRVDKAENGEKCIKRVKTFAPQLIILDLMMPKMDGIEVCKTLKYDERTRNIPIIMLTAKTSELDVVVGLQMGADDYIKKPFSINELMARVKALLRRLKQSKIETNIIRRSGFSIDKSKRFASFNGKELELTHTEFEILTYLISHPEWVFSRKQIMKETRGDEYLTTERAVDVQILNLRRKLKKAGHYIKTVRGSGYKFDD